MHKERKTKNFVIFVAFTSCSYEFLNELQKRLNLVGIAGGSIYKSKKRKFCRLQFSTSGALKLYDFMYNRKVEDFFGLFLNRKKKIFEKFNRLRL
ncbi:hypothetical protein HY311_03650 [Candidatus Nomurabacteria bacterium]|nr:hypothetical protein [Candidatus Nomurabacteria bacterium]